MIINLIRGKGKIIAISSLILIIAGGILIITFLGEISTPVIKGNITVYTSVPSTIVENIKQEFQEDYPEVDVEIFRAGTSIIMEQIFTDVNETGQVGADIVWIADFINIEELKEKGLLQQYKSPELDEVIFIFVDNEDFYTGSRLNTMVVVYNTEIIKEKPQDYTDLLNSSWKGKMGIPDPVVGGSAFYTVSTLALNEDFGWDYFDELNESQCVIAKNNRVLVENISDGDLYIGIALDYTVRNHLKDNPTDPLDYVYPNNGSVVIASPIAITRDCTDLKVSKTFVDWVISTRGQEFLSKEMGITPIRLDVDVPEGMMPLDQLKVIPSNPREIYENKDNILNTLKEIFGL